MFTNLQPIAELDKATGKVYVSNNVSPRDWKEIKTGQQLYYGQLLKVSPGTNANGEKINKYAWVKCNNKGTPTMIPSSLTEWSIAANCAY